MILKNEEGYKVEESSPYNCLERSKHFGRNNSSYGIGGIMKAIDIIENQRQENNEDQ